MHWNLLLWKIDCSFWHIEWRVTCYIINTLLWTFCVCCRNEENLIELYSIISLNWSGRLLGSVTARITNLTLQTTLCGEVCMAWALDGLSAAMLLLCHISRGGLIIVHIISGVLVRICSFFRAVLCLWKSGNTYLGRDLFWSALQIKLILVLRKHCCSILGTEYIWFLRHSVVAFLTPNTHE